MERKMSKMEVRREEMESVTPAMVAVGGALLVEREAVSGGLQIWEYGFAGGSSGQFVIGKQGSAQIWGWRKLVFLGVIRVLAMTFGSR